MKAFTDLKQSKKLAEFLPTESADMCYGIDDDTLKYNSLPWLIPYHKYTAKEFYVPCWSLAALLSVLEHPRCFQGDKHTYWFCGCFDKDKLYHEVEADNPVDACVEMVLQLYKLNLL